MMVAQPKATSTLPESVRRTSQVSGQRGICVGATGSS